MQLVQKNAAHMIEEKVLNAENLQREIQGLFLNDKEMEEVSKQARLLGKPNAAYDMISLCESIIK